MRNHLIGFASVLLALAAPVAVVATGNVFAGAALAVLSIFINVFSE